ncbi:MAG: prepilin-type N-terminal cleavage/methylation domain-containing protein [Phycisphaerales bacterium]|nr:prepilin-type N-terminal cleavage/methylation domain-containing protein [Phycisphaerales bacterium]
MVIRVRSTGFSLIEVLVALVISVVLLLATLVALRASFETYRRTAESVSGNVAGRLVVERLQMMVRGGIDFGPIPPLATDDIIESDELQIQAADGIWTTIRWDPLNEVLLWEQDGESWPLLEGATQVVEGSTRQPFQMRFRDGRWMTHVTIDLIVEADGAASTDLDFEEMPEMRFVGSAMPRRMAWGE